MENARDLLNSLMDAALELSQIIHDLEEDGVELTDEQDKFIAVLRHYGNKVVVCRSSESAIAEITEYLDDRDPPSARPGA